MPDLLETAAEPHPNGLVPNVLPYVNSGDRFDPRWPSETPVSEMNLQEWEALVDEFDLRSEDCERVLTGLRLGFDQGIPDHLLGPRKWFTPPNHKSALMTK